MAWVYQTRQSGLFETSPIVADGRMHAHSRRGTGHGPRRPDRPPAGCRPSCRETSSALVPPRRSTAAWRCSMTVFVGHHRRSSDRAGRPVGRGPLGRGCRRQPGVTFDSRAACARRQGHRRRLRGRGRHWRVHLCVRIDDGGDSGGRSPFPPRVNPVQMPAATVGNGGGSTWLTGSTIRL